MTKSFTFGLTVILIGSATRCFALPQDVVEKTEHATALVVVTTEFGPAFGSAFCFDSKGYFATDAHVVLPIAGRIQMVIHPGEKDQRVVNARVVGADTACDLAVLQVENDTGPLSVLTLGDSDKLYATQEITVFGYPFGDDLTVEKDSYPAVSVNSGKITSLRKKSTGELDFVQIDAVTNPGNSGGPIVDDQGRVVGLVESGLLGSGINFATPIAKLKEMIAKPMIDVEPGIVRWFQRMDSADITVRVSWLNHSLTDFQVKLSLKDDEDDASPRVSSGQTTKGSWTTSIVPLTVVNTSGGKPSELPYIIYDVTLSSNGQTAASAKGLIAFTGEETSSYVFPGRPAARGGRGRGAQANGARGGRAGRGTQPTTVYVTMDPMPVDTQEIGPTGDANGAEFRVVDFSERVIVGLSFTTDKVNNALAFRDIDFEYTRPDTDSPSNFITARDGYVVGGLNVEATASTINALQIIFIRAKSDGTLVPSDVYTSDWVGYATAKPTIKTLGGKGERIVGLAGFKSRADQISAIGLIEELPPGKAPHAQQIPLLALPTQ